MCRKLENKKDDVVTVEEIHSTSAVYYAKQHTYREYPWFIYLLLIHLNFNEGITGSVGEGCRRRNRRQSNNLSTMYMKCYKCATLSPYCIAKQAIRDRWVFLYTTGKQKGEGNEVKYLQFDLIPTRKDFPPWLTWKFL